jgi:hypothetical protein
MSSTKIEYIILIQPLHWAKSTHILSRLDIDDLKIQEEEVLALLSKIRI